jgi:hypothetical protein
MHISARTAVSFDAEQEWFLKSYPSGSGLAEKIPERQEREWRQMRSNVLNSTGDWQ